jgi:hypothetical protein
MKLAHIAPATVTVTVAGQKVELTGAESIALGPILSGKRVKLSEFLASPMDHPEVGLEFFLLCFAGRDNKKEATAFYRSLVIGQQNRLLGKCIDVSFPPPEGEAESPPESSPDNQAAEEA